MTESGQDTFPPPTPASPDDPLGFLEREHDRQAQICDWVERLIDQLDREPVPEQARQLLTFIRDDLPLHILDEEGGLFPLLRRRAQPEDEIDGVLDKLSSEHELDKDLVEFITEDLAYIAEGSRVANLARFFANVSGFTETQRRHLEWENRVVLPLARKRLGEDDLKELSARLAKAREETEEAG